MRWLCASLALLTTPAFAEGLDGPSVDPACYAERIATHFAGISLESDESERWAAILQTLEDRVGCLSERYINTCADTASWEDSIACHRSIEAQAKANVLRLATRPLPGTLQNLRSDVLVALPAGCPAGSEPPRAVVSADEAEMMCKVRSDIVTANLLEALGQIADATPTIWGAE